MCNSTCALIKENDQFAVVDSHACNSNGVPDGNGLSIALYFNSIDDVSNHILWLALHFNCDEQEQFELCSF